MNTKTEIRPGDIVCVRLSGGGFGSTNYEVAEVNGFACMIREINETTGARYAAQRFDTSLLYRLGPKR